MSQDTKLQQLVINKLTTAQYNAAVEAGTINPNQLYMTTDSVTVDNITVDGTSIVDDNAVELGTMALEDASDYSTTTVANGLYAAKGLETTVSNHTSATNPHNITKSTIGLGNVDNTADLDKPISTATQTALNNKVDKTSSANKIYGTDGSGVQTTFDKSNFGKVDDVTVNGTSVVSNQVAALGSMAGQNTTSYYTKTEIDGKLSAGMHYKGTVANAAALENISSPDVGDMYNVTDTGANYAWSGTAWDKLSENIDLSGCVPTSRTINGKALSSDITLSASDVGALPDSTVIPTVNNATLTIQKNGTTIDTFTANASTDVTANITVPTTVAELSDASEYVTLSTTQNITGEKTFIGPKRIKFKQSNSSDKLGFTLYNTGSGSNSEVGAFEYNNSSKVDSKAILVLNSNGNTLLGFRYWGSGSSNILAGVPSTAGNYYIPINLTNGTTSVTADKNGIVNISTLIPDALPSQTGNSGKFLTTDGTDASWATVSIPTVNNATLTIQKNGTTVNTFTANSATNTIANITVPEEDNQTIITNSNSKLQVEGIIEQNTHTSTKIWNGTYQQWRDYSPVTFYNYMNGSVPSYITGDSVTVDNIRGMMGLVYGAGKFITFSWDGPLNYSTDGHTWTQGANFEADIDPKISFANDKFYVNNQYSTDGISWWGRVNGVDSDSNTLSEVVYDGEAYYIISGWDFDVLTSSDGINFFTSLSNFSDFYESHLLYIGEKFIAYNNSNAYFSDDAINWTSLSLEIGFDTIAYGNGKFVVINGNNFAYSTDCINWNYGTLPTYASTKLVFGGGVFCTGNLYSTDGISWLQVINPSSGFIAYGNNKFVVSPGGRGSASTSYLDLNSSSTTSYYTEEYPATTSSVVYSAPEVTAGLSIISIDGDDITLSDGNTYSYLSSGNISAYRTVAQIHPDWICNINNVGVKIGNTTIATVYSGPSLTYNSNTETLTIR